MKLRLRFVQRFIFIFFLLLSLHSQGWSQPGQDQDADQDQSSPDGESSTNGFGDPGGDPDLPIDSNIFILVAAGVGYGLKKIYDLKIKKAISQNIIVK